MLGGERDGVLDQLRVVSRQRRVAAEGYPVVPFAVTTPGDIAGFIYDISAATNQGEDIRVCAIGGVCVTDGLIWETAIINRHKD